MNQRFGELDGLRGLAAAAVVVYHFTGSYDAFYPDEPPSPINVWWGMFGVQLFFMISGFVILMTAQRARRPSDFAISRASRLYPAYWVALALSILVTWAAAVPHEAMTWWQRLLNVTMVQRWFLQPNVDDVYWTLAIEMQFYVMVFLLLVLTRCRLTPRVVVGAALAWVVAGLVVSLWAAPVAHGVNPQHVPTLHKIALNVVLAEWGPLFSAGMFAFLGRSDRRYRVPAVAMGGIAVLVAGLLNTWTYAAVVGAMVVVFMVVAFRERTGLLLWRPVQFYGRISYSLYIGHSIHGTALMHALIPHVGRVPAMIIAFVGVTGVAWAIHEVGEVRGTRLAKRWLTSLQRGRHDSAAEAAS